MTSLKSILQAITTRYCAVTFPITTYPISVFKFSAGLCDDLMQMIKNFWWDDDNERRRIHWTSREGVSKIETNRHI